MYNSYFTATELLNKNALINLALSDRSDGKTLDIKVRKFCEWYKNKTTGIYLRRWKTEFTREMFEQFYDELIYKVQHNEYVPENKEVAEIISHILDYDFLGTKSRIYIRKKGDKKWETLLYLMPLTMSSKLKSTLDITKITSIEYDEFVPLDNRYIPNEMHLLMELYKSVDRDRDTTKLNLFGNRIDMFNPFFDFFDIHLGIETEKLRLYKDDTIAIQIYVNKEHREERNKSRFSTAIKGTSYDNYNKGGVLNSKQIKIGNIDGCVYFASFKSSLGEGSIYTSNTKFVVSSKIRKDGSVITDKIYNTGRDECLVTFGKLPTYIKNRYRCGEVYFDSEKTFHIFEPILNKIGGVK